ncbi:sialidase-4 [Poecilia latipinna]|uniref:exo-alpha-sialidase n=1 Tax=Poecilia latipinna TaxID=48699 RepID=A0A3B3V0G1_9TELE|nr:PREDICTED: sialidase-4-like [Poecilia latipinna]XP_014898376.1 PREDICTED: sialidase-4-like [Poecilia latipinna]XP_014898377.1 PREDICTED: sialidase-4-like [Poecilia latipinna]
MRSPYFPARSVLFHKEPNGVTYRVPALLYLSRFRSFLAFCEERLTPSDSQAHLLVMRKGSFYRNYVEWKDMCVLGTAFLPGHRSMNPCPVYDEFTGILFLFFIAVLGHTSESYQLVTGDNVTRLCYISSADGGDTWSPVTDLTDTVIGGTIKDWATFALGPGHGIQLKSGRLLIPAYAYHIDCRECFGHLCLTTPRAFCFHSDTHGRSWRFGEPIPAPESVECQMVSVDEEDGSNVLYCNARSPLGYRVQALSLDDGAVFQEGQLVQSLVEPRNGCHGSVVGFPAPLRACEAHGGRTSPCRHWTSLTGHTDRSHSAPRPDFLTPTWVVYSHPTWTTARRDLGVFLSLFPRDPDSWRGPWVIYEGPSAYSDLAYLELSPSPGEPPAVAFACLFECGTKTAYDEICFSVFSLYELINNLPRAAAGPRTDRRDNKTQQADCEVAGEQEPRNAPVVHQMAHVKKRRRRRKLMKMCSVS